MGHAIIKVMATLAASLHPWLADCRSELEGSIPQVTAGGHANSCKLKSIMPNNYKTIEAT